MAFDDLFTTLDSLDEKESPVQPARLGALKRAAGIPDVPESPEVDAWTPDSSRYENPYSELSAAAKTPKLLDILLGTSAIAAGTAAGEKGIANMQGSVASRRADEQYRRGLQQQEVDYSSVIDERKQLDKLRMAKPELRDLPDDMVGPMLMKLMEYEQRAKYPTQQYEPTDVRRDRRLREIDAMPENTPEEVAAKEREQYYYDRSSDVAGSRQMSPEWAETQTDLAGKKAAASSGARIKTESDLADVASDTAAKKAGATETGRRVARQEQAAKGLWKEISLAQSEDLGRISQAVTAQRKMAKMLDSGEADFFDFTAAGRLKNPEAYQLKQIVDEYYARPLSGAAINQKEWTKFESEVMDKWSTLTDAGKETAVNRLRQLANSNYSIGAQYTQDPQWLGRMRQASTPKFDSEEQARQAGMGANDEVQLLIDGKYRTVRLRD